MSMRFLFSAFAALAFILTCGAVRSQTLHYISVADTADVELPKEFTANQAAFDNFISSISKKDSTASITGLKLNPLPLNGKDFNCENILGKIDSLQLDQSNDDVIVFYYSGHGQSPKERAQDPNNSDYPKLLCGMTSNDPMPNLEEIFNKLKSKKARLLLVGADGCNNIAAPPAALEEGKQTKLEDAKIRDLFRSYRANILISSAKPGEFAFYKEHSLGYFTTRFLDLLATPPSMIQGDNDAWDAVLRAAKLEINIPKHIQLPDESPMQRHQHPESLRN
jgi:Caspase domain